MRRLVGLLGLLFALNSGFSYASSLKKENGFLEFYFLDVGNADATIIKTPDDDYILIDGGFSWSYPEISQKLDELGCDTLDAVIASHPHGDHIGGLPQIIDEYNPRLIIDNGQKSKSFSYYKYNKIAKKNNRISMTNDTTMYVGEYVELNIFVPYGEGLNKKANDNSLVVVVNYLEFSAWFSGDLQIQGQESIFDLGKFQDVDLLKPGHHGHRNGTNSETLEYLKPEVAIMHTKKEKPKSSPHDEVLDLFSEYGVEVYRTDIHGTISLVTDGSLYYVESNKKALIAQVPRDLTRLYLKFSFNVKENIYKSNFFLNN
ncbi:MBL fold metallo-hydrolase [Candidatus Woesearchaeota archaeon]|nr:MBL fold metallo-hydrolase [Candidatus Woesearchaeota archaeon]